MYADAMVEESQGRKGETFAGVGCWWWWWWWSAVVHCKSPSTAFNYDVIANTDDGYFLRYTLYITRGPTASPSPTGSPGPVPPPPPPPPPAPAPEREPRAVRFRVL